MSDMVNPYIAGSPVTGSEMFFGREDVFDYICRTLTGLHRDNVIVLYGQRRTGKTSVLYHMRAHVGERYLCIFMDLHGFALEGLGGFLWEMANHIVRVLHRDYQIDLSRPNRSEFMADPRGFFENEFLNHVWSAIGERHVLLMFDEAVRLQEQVQAGKLEHEIFEYLRYLMQHYERLNFLFSLGSGLEEMEQEYAFLFSVGLYKKISFLDRDDTSALITQPVKDYYQIEAAALDRILQITSGHPYYTQLLCHSLFNRWQQQQQHVAQIAVRDVDEVLDEVVERGSANLKYVWEESTPGERAVLAGIAAAMGDANRAVEVDEINQMWARCDAVIPRGEMAKAIKHLITRDVIAGQDKYAFTVDLQRMWVQKYKRLEWVEEEVAHTLLLNTPQPIPTQAAPEPTRALTPRRRPRVLYLAFALFIIVLVSLSLGVHSLLSQKGTTGLPGTPSQVVGYVSFASSGQIGQNASQGITDELSIDLQHIPSPHAGKSYYAWLLGDNNNSEALPILLGKLSVDHGRVHYSYAGDPQHTSLIASTSRFLITEEDSSTLPSFPSTGPGTRLYYAEIPQTPSPRDTLHHYSLLDHLRHLLSGDPKLNTARLYGGLDFWFLRNTAEISQWAGEAASAWQKKDTNAIRQHVIDMLYYLDGLSCIESDLNGVPQGTPMAPENATIGNTARVGLLQLCTQLPIPDYLHHILTHLNGLIDSPGVRADQVKIVSQIITEMNHVGILLKKVYRDAQQLVKMTDAQLLQPSAQSIVNDMATQAIYAYSGQTSPATAQVQPGVQQVHDEIERLATLDVTPCPSSSTSNVCA